MSNDPLVDVLGAVVAALRGAGVEYAVTGSIASSVHGEPITSQDVDIAVRMDRDQARAFVRLAPARFYRSEEAFESAVLRAGMANLVDMETGLKVDISVLAPSRFHDAVMRRAEEVRLGAAPDAPSFQFVTAEDVILMKLVWRRESQSRKQWLNALGVVRTRGARLDWAYLMDQARELGIETDLIRLRDEGGV